MSWSVDDPTESIATFFDDLTRLIRNDDPRAVIQGLTKSEIRQLQADQGIDALPAAYFEFLHRMGRRTGRLLSGTDAFYPTILGIRARAEMLLRDNSAGHLLPQTAIIIGLHQGYQVYWLDGASDPDPAVFLYSEGDVGLHQSWISFTTFLIEQSWHDLRNRS